MKRLVPVLAALAVLPACGSDAPHATVENAVVTMPAAPGRPGAAYFTIRATQAAHLTGVSSPQARRVELHQTMNMAGMSQMAPLGDAPVGPDAPLVFEPGARHAMLYDISPSLRAGGKITLTFTFDTLPPVTLDADLRAPGEAHSGH